MNKNRRTTYSSAQTTSGVGDLDVQLGGALNDGDTLLGGDVVRNLGSKDAVVHEEELKVPYVVDEKLLEAVGEDVTSVGVGTVTDLGHRDSASNRVKGSPTLFLASRLTTYWPLNLRRTLLSIPLGFLHDSYMRYSNVNNPHNNSGVHAGRLRTSTFL